MTVKHGQKVVAIGSALILLAMVATSCKTPLATRKVTESGFLGDYSMLSPGVDGQAKLVYINPMTDFSKYDKIIVAPVTVRVTEDSKLDKLPKDQLKALINYLDATVREHLKADYQIVNTPGPGVMTLRLAVTEAKGARVVLNTLSSVVPIGMAVDVAKWAATGTHTSVGEASIEAEMIDSTTGQRLMAAVDARAGRKVIASGNFTKWGDVRDAYDYWAGRLQVRLAELKAR